MRVVSSLRKQREPLIGLKLQTNTWHAVIDCEWDTLTNDRAMPPLSLLLQMTSKTNILTSIFQAFLHDLKSTLQHLYNNWCKQWPVTCQGKKTGVWSRETLNGATTTNSNNRPSNNGTIPISITATKSDFNAWNNTLLYYTTLLTCSYCSIIKISNFLTTVCLIILYERLLVGTYFSKLTCVFYNFWAFLFHCWFNCVNV